MLAKNHRKVRHDRDAAGSNSDEPLCDFTDNIEKLERPRGHRETHASVPIIGDRTMHDARVGPFHVTTGERQSTVGKPAGQDERELLAGVTMLGHTLTACNLQKPRLSPPVGTGQNELLHARTDPPPFDVFKITADPAPQRLRKDIRRPR